MARGRVLRTVLDRLAVDAPLGALETSGLEWLSIAGARFRCGVLLDDIGVEPVRLLQVAASHTSVTAPASPAQGNGPQC